MAESISGRLRTLLGNKSADVDQPSEERVRSEPKPVAAHNPPFVSTPALPPDAAVRFDASAPEAPAAPEPPPTPTLPTDLPGARMYQAELQHKMTALAEDFSLGKINRRQFDAVYTHYREQRQIVDALINSLNFDAWRKAISAGHTGLLLSHNAAQLLGYALYDRATRQPLAVSPHFKVNPAFIAPIIAAQQATRDVTTRISTSEIDNGRWLCFVPGQACTLVALFTVEPARAQLQLLQDLHHDFELANAKRLAQGRGSEAAEQFMQLWALEQAS
ncbi:MAG: hypothetical protein KA765_10155 [Thermoflexales bacterium]|nr:hypothetical protein [Thermoflexales bacterium]